MKRLGFGLIQISVLLMGLGIFASPSRASVWLCYGNYSVTDTAMGNTYNQAYNNLVVSLQNQASNRDVFCRVLGTCHEVFTVTRSDYQEDLGIWLLKGREDFGCYYDL